MKNDNPNTMSVAEAVAHSFPLEVLQEAVRIRTAQSGRQIDQKIDPFDTPFPDSREDFGKTKE
jgi:hypothetical protein